MSFKDTEYLISGYLLNRCRYLFIVLTLNLINVYIIDIATQIMVAVNFKIMNSS